MVVTLQDYMDSIYPKIKSKIPDKYSVIQAYSKNRQAIFVIEDKRMSAYLTDDQLHWFSILTIVEGVVIKDEKKFFGVSYDLLNPPCTCGSAAVNSSKHSWYCDIVKMAKLI